MLASLGSIRIASSFFCLPDRRFDGQHELRVFSRPAPLLQPRQCRPPTNPIASQHSRISDSTNRKVPHVEPNSDATSSLVFGKTVALIRLDHSNLTICFSTGFFAGVAGQVLCHHWLTCPYHAETSCLSLRMETLDRNLPNQRSCCHPEHFWRPLRMGSARLGIEAAFCSTSNRLPRRSRSPPLFWFFQSLSKCFGQAHVSKSWLNKCLETAVSC